MNIKLTEEEIKQLIEKYKNYEKVGLINYAEFCDNIDKVFGEVADPKEVIGKSKSTAVSNG